jgi:TonB-linked SusC/RagA family outer membrane protein
MKPDNYKKMRLPLLLLVLSCLHLAVYGQQRTVTGRVTDEAGTTLPGVTVAIPGTTRGTNTDFDGRYSIEASASDTLQFSFIGMVTQKIRVGAQTVIDVTLVAEVAAIDEVVVVGYGVQRKESVVAAISQVSGERLRNVKTGGGIESTLQGNLPGLTVIMQDPTPGEESNSITLQIRGTASMGSNTPLVLVDGVERSFGNLDPNEIASISILKDASATSIYGVRGANGVIIVTTKRGMKGAVQLDFTASTSIKSPTRLPEYLNAYETLVMRNEAYRNDGKWSSIIPDDILELYRTQESPYLYPDFDWMDFYFKPALDQSYNLNARGGNDFVHYFSSLSYLQEGDVFTVGELFPYEYEKHSAGYWHKRYNFRNNMDFFITPTTKLTFNLGGNLKVWNKPVDNYTQEIWFEPVTVMPYYPEEAVQQFPDNLIPYNQTGIRPMINPAQGNIRLQWTGGRGFMRNKSNDVQSDVILNQKLDFITPGLSIQANYSINSTFGYRQNFPLSQYYGFYLNPSDSTWTRYHQDAGIDNETPQPKLTVTNNENLTGASRSHYYRIQTNYGRTFGKHRVSALGVFARRIARGTSSFPTYQEDWVGRATYSYDDKYMFETSISHTGSEKFAPGLRFGTFPSFAVGWLASEESWFKDALPWVNYFKPRYSWGMVGSDAGIARWLYISEYTTASGGVSFGLPLQSYSYIQEGTIPVTDATWETAIKQNIGIEMAFFRNQITLNVDLFNERRENILQTRRSVPSWVGVSSISGNIGETKSHGFEVELGWNKTFLNGFGLFGRLNLSGAESRVIYYDESANVPFHLKAEGKPVGIAQRMGYYTPATGVLNPGYYQDFDELFMWPVAGGRAPIVGDLKYVDFNGDGAVNSLDRVVSENPFVPIFNWSSTLGFMFKSWSLQGDLYGISNTQYSLRQGGMFYLYPFSQNKDNAMRVHADYWTPENRDASYPAVHSIATEQYNYQINQFGMIEGKYIRLRNVRLNYKVQAGALDRLGIRNMDISLLGTNLFTWTPFKLGGDPEGFNSGVDFGAYPMLKRFTAEIRVTF